jgi:hypothetical protein
MLLRGLTYRDIKVPEGRTWDPAEWLRAVHPFDPQPYEQLATALRRSGYEDEATAVDIAKYDARLSGDGVRWVTRVKGKTLRGTIMYGYRVQRMLLVALLMSVLGTWFFGVGYEGNVIVPTEQRSRTEGQSEYPPFSAAVYSLDALLPIVDLHQEAYWLPSGDGQCTFWLPRYTLASCGGPLRFYLWVHILVGWATSTLIVVGLTGLVRQGGRS